MYTDRPFDRYLWQFSAWSPQTVTRCHSVRSCRCPDLSLKTSVVAMRRLQRGRLDGVYLSSGSAPRFPTRMTLFTLPMASPSITLAVRYADEFSVGATVGCAWCKVLG